MPAVISRCEYPCHLFCLAPRLHTACTHDRLVPECTISPQHADCKTDYASTGRWERAPGTYEAAAARWQGGREARPEQLGSFGRVCRTQGPGFGHQPPRHRSPRWPPPVSSPAANRGPVCLLLLSETPCSAPSAVRRKALHACLRTMLQVRCFLHPCSSATTTALPASPCTPSVCERAADRALLHTRLAAPLETGPQRGGGLKGGAAAGFWAAAAAGRVRAAYATSCTAPPTCEGRGGGGRQRRRQAGLSGQAHGPPGLGPATAQHPPHKEARLSSLTADPSAPP